MANQVRGLGGGGGGSREAWYTPDEGSSSVNLKDRELVMGSSTSPRLESICSCVFCETQI